MMDVCYPKCTSATVTEQGNIILSKQRLGFGCFLKRFVSCFYRAFYFEWYLVLSKSNNTRYNKK